MAESATPLLNRRARRAGDRLTAAHVRAVGAEGDGGRRAAAPAAAGLGKYANRSSPNRRPKPSTPGERRNRRNQKRRDRYLLRLRLRQITTLKRVKDCGHVSITGGDSGPGVRVSSGLNGSGRSAGMVGLAHCGSVWACPACSAKIAVRRASELADVMRWALEQGCSATMATLTMRHNKGHTLRDCWDAVSYAWAAVTSGKQWTEDQQMAGLVGWVKAVEVTRGESGWHVHLHVLMIWRNDISADAGEAVSERMWTRWSRALRRFKPKNKKAGGFDSLRHDANGHDVGLDVRKATLTPDGNGLHQYFVKLSHEITGGQGKVAMGSGRTPFQILKNALDTGLADDLELWWQWEKASRGRRQMSWSKDLRELAKLEPELTDEEIAQEELQGDDLLFLEPVSWRTIRSDSGKVCDLLEAAELRGFAGAAELLDTWGLPWLLGRSASPRPSPLVMDSYRAFPVTTV